MGPDETWTLLENSFSTSHYEFRVSTSSDPRFPNLEWLFFCRWRQPCCLELGKPLRGKTGPRQTRPGATVRSERPYRRRYNPLSPSLYTVVLPIVHPSDILLPYPSSFTCLPFSSLTYDTLPSNRVSSRPVTDTFHREDVQITDVYNYVTEVSPFDQSRCKWQQTWCRVSTFPSEYTFKGNR